MRPARQPNVVHHFGEEAIGFAYAVPIEALNLLGETLQEMEKSKGGYLPVPKGNYSVETPVAATPTLAELGINKKTSMVVEGIGVPKRNPN